MKKLHSILEGMFADSIYEGMFDIEDNVDKINKELKWKREFEKYISSQDGEKLKKTFIEYLEEVRTRKTKRLTGKDIEVLIYGDDGFTLFNWKGNECWTLHEFNDIEYQSYGDIEPFDGYKSPVKYYNNSYDISIVYKINQETFEFIKDVFFDFDY